MTSGTGGVRVRLVLREGVDRDAIDEAFAERGCRLINVVQPGPGHPAQMIYSARDRRSVLHLVEDALLGVAYISGDGEGADVELEALRARLAVYGEADVASLAAAACDAAGAARTLGVLALTSGLEPDETRIRVFEKALTDERVDVRLTALVALSYVRWLALRDRVAQIAAGDVDGVVRLHAARLLEMYGP
jgi:hypothetical protein